MAMDITRITLPDRHRKVFEVVLKEYIKKGEPVGSRTVSKVLRGKWSPATIRSVMSDLEDWGLLFQPHASAGRVPTEMGIRFYIENFVRKGIGAKPVSEKEKAIIMDAVSPKGKTLEDLLMNVSEVLSSLSRYSGIAVMPKPALMRLKYVEFLKMGRSRVLVVMVTFSGSIFNRVVEVEEDISQTELDKMSSYLNSRFVGYTIVETRKMIFEEMKSDKSRYDQMLKKALKIGSEALKNVGEQKLFVKGQANVIVEPEFSDAHKMKALFKAFEEKSVIVEILDRVMESPGPSVILGRDFPLRYLRNIGIVASPYYVDDTSVGTIGIVGPMRMDYNKVISLVDFTAKTLRKALGSQE